MPIVTPSDQSYSTAIHTHKNLTLPDFQRSLVWTNQQKSDLLFSTLLGFPIGAICVGKEIDPSTNNPVEYLLDGQQRLDCIIDMMDPANPFRWLEIQSPWGVAHGFPTKPTNLQEENYYEIMIWSRIYEFLDFKFGESTEEYDKLQSDPKYKKAEELKIKHNQEVAIGIKGSKSKANEQSQIMWEMEFNARQSWVNRLHSEPPKLPDENKSIPAFIAIYNEHLIDPEITVLQKSLWNDFDPSPFGKSREEGYQELYNDLIGVKADEGEIISCIFKAVGPENLKTTPPTLNPDPVKAQKQKDKAIEKFEQAIAKSMPDITNYLTQRLGFRSQIQGHKLGWLTFDAGTSRPFHANELAKVFSLVNMSGVELSPIELLAARSGWRTPVKIDKTDKGDMKLFEAYRKISSRMGLHRKSEIELSSEIVNKWHLASGFGAVMRDNQTSNELEWILIIPENPKLPEEIEAITNRNTREKEAKARRTAIEKLSQFGFVTLGLLQFQSVTAPTWKGLDQSNTDWKSILQMIKSCRGAGKLLREDPFFENIISFAKKEDGAIESILGSQYAARSFFANMHKRYEKLNCPTLPGDPNGEEFIFEMRRLFDDLLYKSITGYWVGKADEKLPDSIDNYSEKIQRTLIVNDRWEKLLQKMCVDGTIGDTDYHKTKATVDKDGNLVLKTQDYHKSIYSILAYHQVLQGRNRDDVKISPMKDDVYEFDVDHIIPRKEWYSHLAPDAHDLIDVLRPKNFTHNITNMTLLGYDANRSKQDKTIDVWFNDAKKDSKYQQMIQDHLHFFADLPKDIKELKKMNMPNKYPALCKLRTKKLVDVFSPSNRKKYFFP